jgi:FdhD protein
MSDTGSYPITYSGYYGGECRPVHGVLPVEETITLYVNGQPLVNLMCTPVQVEELALGFLFNEGLIEIMDDVAVLELCGGERCVDVWLEHDVDIPQLRVITSGCSGGTTFEDVADVHHRIVSNARVTPQQVTRLMKELDAAAALYARAGGVHTTALSDGERLLFVAEDIGRHNTLDKVAGTCLRQGQVMHDHVLLTSGRVSSEMVHKVARMKVPIVISRTSPTSLSAQLARAWGITLIGYTRRRSFRTYAGEERIVVPVSCSAAEEDG